MSPSIDPQTQAMIDAMPEKTGKALTEWYALFEAAHLSSHSEIMRLLKEQYGVSHGYANTISILFRQQAAGGAPTESSLVDAQYAGAKAALRPIYEAVLAAVSAFGPDVEIAPKKTYVSLRRSKQFAIVQASTKTRVDLGLNLKEVAPTERLEGGNPFGGMCTHRVALTSPAEVDAAVVGWLQQAYDQA
ncbi:MAG: DUF4287 domain-containing protein [Dehalococcoidia bacterium]|nr:DUF4287 domain-containing protein [Dehalococcoidia bacterium]